MDSAKKWKMVGLAMGVLLLCSLGGLAYTLYDNHSCRHVLEIVSQEAGLSSAMVSFYQGNLRIYEIDKSKTEGGFSGHREGPFEVWFDTYRAEDPEVFTKALFGGTQQNDALYAGPSQEVPGRFRCNHKQCAMNGAPNEKSV